eukprot:scaffold81807_cov41-Phaeocystis_antarctica.AAC.1
MNVETCGHVADLIVMAHAFAELRDGIVARQHEERFQIWAQFRPHPLESRPWGRLAPGGYGEPRLAGRGPARRA